MSRKTQANLNQYLSKDPELHQEIEKRLGKVQGLEINDSVETNLNADQYDDSDIPISAIVQDELGLTISTQADDNESMEKIQKVNDELIANGLEEDIWAYDQVGNRWDEIENGAIPIQFSEDAEG